MIALDTETTGLDFYHGARPFLVTTCTDEGEQKWWEWDVDPLTRNVSVVDSDIDEIKEALAEHDRVVLQNSKFDVLALDEAGHIKDWDWSKTDDTLVAGHLLDTTPPHDLTSMASRYLTKNIQPFEDRLEKAVAECRSRVHQAKLARKRNKPKTDGDDVLADWAIAEAGRQDMPSAKEKTWKIDVWLPRAFAAHFEFDRPDVDCDHLRWDDERRRKVPAWDDESWACSKCGGHRFWLVCSDYANEDSKTTAELWPCLEDLIRRRDLWAIYKACMAVTRPTYRMERFGLTGIETELNALRDEYTRDSETRANVCVNIAASLNYELTLPKSGNNKSLMRFCFGYTAQRCDTCNTEIEIGRELLEASREKEAKGLYCKNCTVAGFDPQGRPRVIEETNLGLPIVVWTETNNPSLNKEAMDIYELTLSRNSKQFSFIKALHDKRRMDTAVTYMTGYERFWLDNGHAGFKVLHPSFNPTGTYTTRFSSNNPNAQNFSKKEGFNLRRCFGPGPGREWWALDGKNMELRFPAYESGEEAMIALFEEPDAPPYFGSNHLLVAHLIWPKEFEACRDANGQIDGRIFKKKYAASLYDRLKRGNFATQYSAGDETADAAFGVKGARALIKARFAKQDALERKYRKFADQHGYVETLPDKTVDPKRGFPVVCKTNDYGRVKSTVPFSNHIQGSVGWWARMCMIRTDEYMEVLTRETKRLHCMIAQVHDELVLDFPVGKGEKPWLTNLPKVKQVKKLMEECGSNLGIPTLCGLEYHSKNYAEGLSIDD